MCNFDKNKINKLKANKIRLIKQQSKESLGKKVLKLERIHQADVLLTQILK